MSRLQEYEMTGFESKRQAAQDKMELADAYASAVAATPNMPTPLERKLAVERIERARNALEAALEQQAEPSQWRDMIVVSLVREGIDKHKARALADHFAAQQQAEPVQERITRIAWDERGVRTVNGIPDDSPQQQAEPPPEWPLIKNILAVFGLDAIAFVAEFKAAQRQWVGLEIEEVQDSYNSDYQAQTRAVEKLLKERNT